MGLYIYSSALRRALKTSLETEAASFSVAVIGNRPLEELLFRNVASTIDRVAADDATRRFTDYDVILCGTEDLPALCRHLSAPDGEPAPPTVKAIAVRGATRSISSSDVESIAALCTGLGLTLLNQRMETTDFGRGSETDFLLVRADGAQADSPLDLLKMSVIVEAHSLHAEALKVLERYNAKVGDPDRMIDPSIVDRTYEVPAFGGNALGQSEPLAADANTVLPGDGAEPADRALSIHFDQFYREDGAARLRHLAHWLALPERAGIVVRVPGSAFPPSWTRLHAEIEALGPTVTGFLDPAFPCDSNPCAAGFLAATAPNAAIAVYYAEHEPIAPGWDYDLLRAANQANGRFFVLKISEHKTRNYASREDAERAPESMPAVSRAWLEACGTWSMPHVSPGVFQKLVAFYSDRLDWTNKHRELRLYPVMTLSTQPLESADGLQPQVHGDRGRSGSAVLAAQHRAIEVALKIHALESCERLGIDGLRTECDPEGRRVALRSSSGKILKSWVIPMDRFRLPL